MGRSSSCSSSSGTSSNNICWFLKSLVRALAVVGLIWILLVGTPEGRGGSTTKTSTTTTATFAAESAPGRVKTTSNQVVVGTESKLVHPKLDLINYMSKRRVPNGPDPIHNRRAGKSGRPPGQA